MTSTASAIRSMLEESKNVIATHKPDYPHVAAWQARVNAVGDDEVLKLVHQHLSPHTELIKSKNISELSKAFPQYELQELHSALPVPVQDKLWAELGMLTMLISTVSLVPPDMLKQIESFASVMANNMQGGNFNPNDLGGALSSMFGGAAAEEPVPNARRRVRRNRQRNSSSNSAGAAPLTAQEKFRKTLV